MAGHSKWANIKHRKSRQDAKRGKLWSKCARAIIAAAKNGGGNPETNLTLRYAIDEAKAANMPKDTIENAIKKGAGQVETESYESIVYEGYGPGGIAIMLDILTDNRNRTASEVRKTFEKYGGNLGASGCVAYLFQSRGQFYVNKKAIDEDRLYAVTIEAGADDIIDDGDSWQILSDPADFLAVLQALDEVEAKTESAQITMVPNTTITCTGSEAEKLLNLIENLEDLDDIQKVHANFEIPDEQIAAMEP